MSICLRAHNVSLSVPHYIQLSNGSTSSWFDAIIGASTAKPKRVFRDILNNISFAAEDGDRIAIIGRNGAGKSSLLRVLTGAYPPSSGWLEVRGRRQALLNVSLGFNGEATVEENILLRGTAMGMSVDQIRDVSPQVLEFSGLADAAQHRLYTLSAGQRMRLGFAVSTAVDQDIMLLDEWLGAGDAQFIRKARASAVSACSRLTPARSAASVGSSANRSSARASSLLASALRAATVAASRAFAA